MEFLPIEQGDLLAGRKRVMPVGFSNEPLLGRSVGWFYDVPRAMEALQTDGASPEEVEDARKMLDFWAEQETRKICAGSTRQRSHRREDKTCRIASRCTGWVGLIWIITKLLRLGSGRNACPRWSAANKRRRTWGTGERSDACQIALDTSKVCLRWPRPLRPWRKFRKIARKRRSIRRPAVGYCASLPRCAELRPHGHYLGISWAGTWKRRDGPAESVDLTCSLWRLDRCPKDRVPRPGHYRRQRTAPGRKCGPVCAPGHGGQPARGGGRTSGFPALLLRDRTRP